MCFFLFLIAFRLFNEVWSNTMRQSVLILGGYSVLVPIMVLFWSLRSYLAYVIKGDEQQYLFTDVVQREFIFYSIIGIFRGYLLFKSIRLTIHECLLFSE